MKAVLSITISALFLTAAVSGATAVFIGNDEASATGAMQVGVMHVGDHVAFETSWPGEDGVLQVGKTERFDVVAVALTPDHEGLLRQSAVVRIEGDDDAGNGQPTPVFEYVDLGTRAVVRAQQGWSWTDSHIAIDSFDERPARLPALAFQGASLLPGETLRVTAPELDLASGSGAGGGGAMFGPFVTASPPHYTVDLPSWSWLTHTSTDWEAKQETVVDGQRAVVLVHEEPFVEAGADDVPLSRVHQDQARRTQMVLQDGNPYPVSIQTDLVTDGEAETLLRVERASYQAGETPVGWLDERSDAGAVFHAEPTGRNHPTDGAGASLLYGFEEAYEDVTSGPNAPRLKVFLRTTPFAGLVGALALPGPQHTEDRPALAWYFTFAGFNDAFLVMTERIEGVPVPYVEEMGEVNVDARPHPLLDASLTIADAEAAYRATFDDVDAPIDHVAWGDNSFWSTSGTCIVGVASSGGTDVDDRTLMRQMLVGHTSAGPCTIDGDVTLRGVVVDLEQGRLVAAPDMSWPLF